MLRLNTNRTFTVPVPVPYVDEEGKDQSGNFTTTFRVLPGTEAEHPDNAGKSLLGMVVVQIHDDLELYDKDGHKLEGDDLRTAAFADPSIASAMISTYRANVVKKPLPTT